MQLRDPVSHGEQLLYVVPYPCASYRYADLLSL